MMSGLVAEVVLTFMFVEIILGATNELAPAGPAPIVGCALAGFAYRGLRKEGRA